MSILSRVILIIILSIVTYLVMSEDTSSRIVSTMIEPPKNVRVRIISLMPSWWHLDSENIE